MGVLNSLSIEQASDNSGAAFTYFTIDTNRRYSLFKHVVQKYTRMQGVVTSLNMHRNILRRHEG